MSHFSSLLLVNENFRVQKKLDIQGKKVHYIICSDWNVLILISNKFHLFLSFIKQILKQKNISGEDSVALIHISIFEFSSV